MIPYSSYRFSFDFNQKTIHNSTDAYYHTRKFVSGSPKIYHLLYRIDQDTLITAIGYDKAEFDRSFQFGKRYDKLTNNQIYFGAHRGSDGVLSTPGKIWVDYVEVYRIKNLD